MIKISTLKKGQLSPVNIILIIVGLIYFIYVYPILQGFINDAIPTMDSTTATIIALTPAVMLLGILASLWFFVVPQRVER